jgi:PAS domain S-box-containing protein
MGYNEEELKDKMIYDLVAESERTKYIELRKDIIQTNNTFNEISTCFVTKTDEKISVEGSISTIFKDGQPQYTFGIFRDVTQRLRQEKELRSANEQLLEREEHARKLIHNAPDAVIVINVDNIITLWNPKAESIFGFTAEEVTGKTLSDTIIPVAAREGHKQGMQRFLATGEAHILNKTIEVTALHKSGYEFPVSLTVSQSKQAGKVVFISFLRDITTQKKNELEIESKRQQLERSNQELEQFAWLTSHDLKEPLRKILTFSDALLKKHQQNVPPDTLQYLQKIHTSAFRMSNLIEAILLYSNVADAKELFVPCNLNQVLAEVLDDLELIIANKKAVIHTSKLPVIKAIPIQMRQLLQNLLSNGIKYSKPDVTPVIHIYCTTVAHGYQITFTDNGIGFEKAYTEKIFQVFQRLLTNKAYEGTGIGLALCKKIVENHKGTIVAEGEPGEGARFIITLPSR